MYRVIKFFTDLKDNKQPYRVGDEYPRANLKVSQERLEELASDKNRQGVPLIEFVPDIMENTENEETVELTETAEQPEQKEIKKRKSNKEPVAEKEE